MGNNIQIGDKVKTNTNGSSYDEMKGIVKEEGATYDWRVSLDDLKYINTAGFDSHELDKLDNYESN